METTQKMIAIHEGSKVTFLNQSDIVYCNIERRITTIYFENDTMVTSKISLKKLITLLDNTQFIITHPAFIINKNYVSSIGLLKNAKYEVVLKDSRKIPLTTSKREALIKLLSNVLIHGKYKTLR